MGTLVLVFTGSGTKVLGRRSNSTGKHGDVFEPELCVVSLYPLMVPSQTEGGCGGRFPCLTHTDSPTSFVRIIYLLTGAREPGFGDTGDVTDRGTRGYPEKYPSFLNSWDWTGWTRVESLVLLQTEPDFCDGDPRNPLGTQCVNSYQFNSYQWTGSPSRTPLEVYGGWGGFAEVGV